MISTLRAQGLVSCVRKGPHSALSPQLGRSFFFGGLLYFVEAAVSVRALFETFTLTPLAHFAPRASRLVLTAHKLTQRRAFMNKATRICICIGGNQLTIDGKEQAIYRLYSGYYTVNY